MGTDLFKTRVHLMCGEWVMTGSGCEELKQGDQSGGAEAPARDTGDPAYTTVTEVRSPGPGDLRVPGRIGCGRMKPLGAGLRPNRPLDVTMAFPAGRSGSSSLGIQLPISPQMTNPP